MKKLFSILAIMFAGVLTGCDDKVSNNALEEARATAKDNATANAQLSILDGKPIVSITTYEVKNENQIFPSSQPHP